MVISVTVRALDTKVNDVKNIAAMIAALEFLLRQLRQRRHRHLRRRRLQQSLLLVQLKSPVRPNRKLRFERMKFQHRQGQQRKNQQLPIGGETIGYGFWWQYVSSQSQLR